MPNGGSLFFTNETADSTPVLARVGVEAAITLASGDGTLTYRVEGDPPQVGERVDVPLGRRRVPGVVVDVGGRELASGLDESKLRVLRRVGGAVLPPDVVAIARWIAEYYACPLGLVLAGCVPAGVKSGAGRKDRERLSPLADITTPAPAGVPKKAAAIWDTLRAWPHDRFPIDLREACGMLDLRSVATLRTLAKHNLVQIARARSIEAGRVPELASDAPRHELTPQQHAAVERIGAAERTFGVHLIRGVTGSGKTEVYMALMERARHAGRGVLVLVPEISLTPQTAGRFTSRFGASQVAVFHSGLTPAQRNREWSRAAGGEAAIVIGARSAVFAPVRDLGLIVVDEEHDGSYKQDRAPRYHARDIAIVRAKQQGCPVVLGSATPSMESWSHALAGKYALVELTQRPGGAVLPEVRVVDLRDEQRARRESGEDDGRIHLLGPTLERALAQTLDAGGQAILLLNRRGFASYVACRRAACGLVVSCDRCDANLVLHRGAGLPPGGVVRCHHCDASQRVPTLCASCGGPISLWGAGTQRAEDELARKFAGWGLEEGRTLRRVDSDTIRSGAALAELLRDFGEGRVRLLVGTQMIAKGLDFPNVRLVGVVDADTALSLPDFRAAERTFQLVSQVAGRAGRGVQPGRVIVQTWSPDVPAIRLAATHAYPDFAAQELEIRARAGLPPSARLARIVCQAEDAHEAEGAATRLAGVLRAAPGVRVRGPVACVISRIDTRYRFSVELLAPGAGELRAALSLLRGHEDLRGEARAAIDVDPVSLL